METIRRQLMQVDGHSENQGLSLRAQRSNLSRGTPGWRDCFVALLLAMTPRIYRGGILVVGLLTPVTARAVELTVEPRSEITHPGKGHEVQLSGPAVAVDQDGGVFVAWVRREGQTNHLYVGRPGTEAGEAVRVNGEGLAVDSLHQPPGVAIGPGGEIYLSWSSVKPKPEGVLFASDLRLSRSLDGGRSFDSHLRVNEDRPTAHSFEGLAAAADGTVVLSWIDSREGWDKANTYVARVSERGTRVDGVVTLGHDTCVCCRSHITTGPNNAVAVTWRKVFPGDIRDMVLSLSHDGGRSFTPSTLVHADRWQLNACPHRGGSVALNSRGQTYLTWYTEGERGKPAVLFARSSDGRRFTTPQRLDASTGSIPDHVRMAVDAAGRAVIVWEDATAVRRRVLLRSTTDGGRTFGPVQSLSPALKAYAPDVAASPTGGFVVAWHEEQFPVIKTVVQPVHFKDGK